MSAVNRRGQRGFTLLEVILVVAVLAILATALAPALLQRIVEARVDETRAEAKAIYEGMVGRNEDGSSFGFVGDLGRLPATFEELLDGRGLPPQTTTTVQSVRVGWNGPYVNMGRGLRDMLLDGFGRPYSGAGQGQVRSAGPDGIPGNADDIVYPPVAPKVTGRVAVVVKTKANDRVLVDPPGCQVRLFFPQNGLETSLTDAAPPFIFENVPMGLRAVQVVGPTPAGLGVLARETIAVPGGGRTRLVELWY